MKNTVMQTRLTLPNSQKNFLEFRFDSPAETSDTGVTLLSAVASKIGIIQNLASSIRDDRDQSKIDHTIESIIAQRVFQIGMGYEDANDADRLRHDAGFRTSISGDKSALLASQPTLSRLENSVTKRDLIRMGYALVYTFIKSYSKMPKMIVLDMDPTAAYCYGDQQLSLFNRYEDEYCLAPFHVYDGLTGKLITTIIRPGKTPKANEIIAVLKRLVKRIQSAFPKTILMFRADGHHCKPEVLDWLEKHSVEYIIGLPQNSVLNRQFAFCSDQAKSASKQKKKPLRNYASGLYGAQTWSRKRRVISRALVGISGEVDMRYVVTSMKEARAKYLYEAVYCARGNCERFIKEHKVDLMSDRMSCNKATANQFRLFLHSAAYMIFHELRSNLLKGTELATAQFSTIRLRLLKIAARIEFKGRKTVFHLPEHFPKKEIFEKAVSILNLVT